MAALQLRRGIGGDTVAVDREAEIAVGDRIDNIEIFEICAKRFGLESGLAQPLGCVCARCRKSRVDASDDSAVYIRRRWVANDARFLQPRLGPHPLERGRRVAQLQLVDDRPRGRNHSLANDLKSLMLHGVGPEAEVAAAAARDR